MGLFDHLLRDLRSVIDRDGSQNAIPPLDGARVLLRDLPYPYGVAVAPDGEHLWLAESWAHRLSRFALGGDGIGRREMIAGNLPGYPARIHRDAQGGYFLGLFARRTHLIEFVLKEDDFREEMIASMAPDYWIAPALAGGNDCLEPMQIGSVKALGIQKPWAPPRSYGLVARLDTNGHAIESFHSRTSGKFHGVTAVAVDHDRVLVLSKGHGKIAELSVVGASDGKRA